MSPSFSELLEAADDENAEYPHDFDRERLIQRLHTLRLRLEEITSRRFELDDRAQDASFCADLSIQRPGAKPNWIDTVFALRFSNFGDLFTIWSHCEAERLPPSMQQALILAAEKEKFHFVSPEALEHPYAGRCAGAHGATWGDRFFDYL